MGGVKALSAQNKGEKRLSLRWHFGRQEEKKKIKRKGGRELSVICTFHLYPSRTLRLCSHLTSTAPHKSHAGTEFVRFEAPMMLCVKSLGANLSSENAGFITLV